MESGADAFLARPIDEIELTAQIRAMLKMKGINTPGQALDPGGVCLLFRPTGRGISPCFSRHSLGIGTIKMLPFRSLRWGIRVLNMQMRKEKESLATVVEDKTRELKDSNEKTLGLLEAVKREQTLIEAIFDSIPAISTYMTKAEDSYGGIRNMRP